jgi:hypothetical protein
MSASDQTRIALPSRSVSFGAFTLPARIHSCRVALLIPTSLAAHAVVLMTRVFIYTRHVSSI